MFDAFWSLARAFEFTFAVFMLLRLLLVKSCRVLKTCRVLKFGRLFGLGILVSQPSQLREHTRLGRKGLRIATQLKVEGGYGQGCCRNRVGGAGVTCYESLRAHRVSLCYSAWQGPLLLTALASS